MGNISLLMKRGENKMELKLINKFPEQGMTDEENKRIYCNYVFFDPKTKKKVEIRSPNSYHSIPFWSIEEKKPFKTEHITLNLKTQSKISTKRKEDFSKKEAYQIKSNEILNNGYTIYVPCEFEKITNESFKTVSGVEYEVDIFLIIETPLVSFNIKPEFIEESNVFTIAKEVSRKEAVTA